MAYTIDFHAALTAARFEHFKFFLDKYFDRSRFRYGHLAPSKGRDSFDGSTKAHIGKIRLKYNRAYSGATGRSRRLRYLEWADWIGVDLLLCELAMEAGGVRSIKGAHHCGLFFGRSVEAGSLPRRYGHFNPNAPGGLIRVQADAAASHVIEPPPDPVPAATRAFKWVRTPVLGPPTPCARYIFYPADWPGSPEWRLLPDAIPHILRDCSRGIYFDLLPFRTATTGYPERPQEDRIDTDAALICADWFEERGDLVPAQLLRTACANGAAAG